MSNSNTIVEKLIASVARAFYSDNYVVVLDTLVREKYIRDEELAPRLKMIPKDTRKIIQQLESEMLIKFEEMVMDDGRTSKCYYIDYQLFVNIVRYRVFLMKKSITSSEKSVLNDVFYNCPTCKETYSALDAQKLINFEFKFICPNCCPHEDFRTAKSEPRFTLMELDKSLNAVHATLKRFENQLYQSGGSSGSGSNNNSNNSEHDGIFNLLALLKDVPLIRNLPSANRRHGIIASRVADEEIQHEIIESIGYKRVSKEALSKVNRSQVIMGQEVKEKDNFTVTFHDDSSSSSIVSGASAGNMQKGMITNRFQQQQSSSQVKDFALPEFLVDSRVITADQMQSRHQQLQQQQLLSTSITTTAAHIPTLQSYNSAPSSSSRPLQISDNHIKVEASGDMTAVIESKVDETVAVLVERKGGEEENEVEEEKMKEITTMGGVVAAEEDLEDIDWEEDN